MSDLLESSPTEQAVVGDELESTCSAIAELSIEINNIENDLSRYLPVNEIAMLGRRAIKAENRRNVMLRQFAILSIRGFHQSDNSSETDEQIAEPLLDDEAFGRAVEEILSNLSPIEPEAVIAAESEVVEIPQIDPAKETALIQKTELVAPKVKPVKSKKSTKSKSIAKKTSKPSIKPQPAIVKDPKTKKFPPVNERKAYLQARLDARKKYIESRDVVTQITPVIIDRHNKPNFHQELFNYLMDAGKKPAIHPSHKKLGVTIRMFLEIPVSQRPEDWEHRVIDAQLA